MIILGLQLGLKYLETNMAYIDGDPILITCIALHIVYNCLKRLFSIVRCIHDARIEIRIRSATGSCHAEVLESLDLGS